MSVIQQQSRRLVGLDALRGIAASLVMLFHYTTQYDKLYGHTGSLPLSVPWGHYGVNLFFMISGFVIFMTLHKIKRPLDFVVSRFSRLFPMYWAAIAITLFLSLFLPLPDKWADPSTVGMNLFMIHGLLGIPHLDGVYWTLEIELIFYCIALLLYLIGWLDKMHAALLGLIGLRMTWFLAEYFAGIHLSWTLSHLLILPFIAWFACGIVIYRRVTYPLVSPRLDFLVLVAAITQLFVTDGLVQGFLACGLTVLLLAAARGKLQFLASPLLAWLGAISYPLYLLHENIGWGLILQVERGGLSTSISVLVAIVCSLALATAAAKLIEQPAMKWIRTSYRRREVPDLNAKHVVIILSLFAMVAGSLAFFWHRQHPKLASADRAVMQIYQPSEMTSIPCSFDAHPKPLKLLILGQSNAGNHGEPYPARADSRPTAFFFDGKCYQSATLAPGATGSGSNTWTSLAPQLADAIGRPVIISVLAVDSTPILEWVKPGKLKSKLDQTLQDQQRHGFIPDLVLWQQGEADARQGTTHEAYLLRLEQLLRNLKRAGVDVPVVAALSTRCRNDGSPEVRLALQNMSEKHPTFKLGPDTDKLNGEMRHDGCHFSISGQDTAAKLWLEILLPLI